MCTAAFHAPTAEQNGETSLNSSAEPLPLLEDPTFLVGFAFGRPLAATLRNARLLDASSLALINVRLAEEAPIRTVYFWHTTEGLLVAL